MKSRRRAALRTGVLTVLMSGVMAAQDFPDVTAISIEELMNLKVTSVSKRAQKLSDAPAAIFVITQEDIRRSGALNIPDALRLAPGVEVARIDENKWAITSRGFNGRFTNKLLVLIDGRSVYTPLFSGVFWNLQDVLLKDVDRIEVIRGPGATLWGANAVNGVINVIMKEASATQGGMITAEAGNELQGAGAARYGGKLGSRTYYRIYSKYFEVGSSTDENGLDAYDGWDATRGGFRLDSSLTPEDNFTIQGDLYRGGYGETLTVPSFTQPYYSTFRNDGTFSGGNVLARWNHSFTRSNTSLQAYFDKTNTPTSSLLNDHRNIYDVDFQHDIRIADSHEWIWGVGYRATQDRTVGSEYVRLDPDSRSWSHFSAFAQDAFGLFGNRLQVTVGSKFEHNDFSGFDIEPNARALWNVSERHSVWGAVSRAVRTPARTERDMRLNAQVVPPSAESGGLPVQVAVFGSDDFTAEDLIAYETGYRFQATRRFSLDVAGFYNSYSNLLSAEPKAGVLEMTPLPVHIMVPVVAENKTSGVTFGGELFAEWRAAPWWKLSGSYSFLNMDIHRNADSLDSSQNPGDASPRHQYYFRSSMDLTHRFEQDVTLRYVHRLAGLAVPSYHTLDARFAWNATTNLQLFVNGQNLTDNRHLEFRPDFIHTAPTEVKRSFHAGVAWKF